MTNDAERVSDIVARLRELAAEYDTLATGYDAHGNHEDADVEYVKVQFLRAAADIIEAQSKALAEARAIAVRMREITQDVWDKREGYTDRQAWSDLHGQAMQLLGWEVKSRSLTPTPENPNG